MAITDIYTSLKTLLGAGAWVNHTVTPSIREYDLIRFTKNAEGVLIKKNKATGTNTKNGTLLFETQEAEIIIWSKQKETARNNMYEDLLDMLKTDGGYIVKDIKRYDENREHNIRVQVSRLEIR